MPFRGGEGHPRRRNEVGRATVAAVPAPWQTPCVRGSRNEVYPYAPRRQGRQQVNPSPHPSPARGDRRREQRKREVGAGVGDLHLTGELPPLLPVVRQR